METAVQKFKSFKKADSYTLYFLGISVIAISFAIRAISYPVKTDDYIFFLSEWFETLSQNSGLSAFEMIFSNYTPLYLYLLKILTFIPVSSLYSIKTLSVFFDILLALIATLIVRIAFNKSLSKPALFLTFSIFFSIPTLILNSSVWAQSDSIYSTGVLSSFYFLILGSPLLSMIFFGLAFSVKAQSVFFLPALVGFLIKFKKWRALNYLLIVPVIYFVSILPAWVSGGNFRDLIFVYFRQSQEYSALSLNAPSVYALINEEALSETTRNILFYSGLALATIASIGIIYLIINTRPNIKIKEMIFLSLLTVLIVPFLLPGMHERFFFLADVFSLLYAWLDPKRWYIPVLVIASSFFSYMPFLSNSADLFEFLEIGVRIPSIIILFTIGVMAHILFKRKMFR